MKYLRWFAYCSIIVVLIVAGLYYQLLFADNVNNNPTEKYHILYLSTGSEYEDVLNKIQQKGLLKNTASFKRLSGKLHYPAHVHSGKYIIPNNIGNLALLRMLRSGAQTPVRLVINNVSTPEDLLDKLATNLEVRRNTLEEVLFKDKRWMDSLDFTEENILGMFLCNTYEFYWDINAFSFRDKMYQEYHKFWTDRRKAQAEQLGISPMEAIIIASIVQKESNQSKEYDKIASVYINRFKKEWPLQADPTVMYALKKMGIQKKRVYGSDTKIKSPYNTYQNRGLPPGPICLPELHTIDAVLQTKGYDYMYFCAKEDFSGYHNFASTYEAHQLNARKYQRALNQRNIR